MAIFILNNANTDFLKIGRLVRNDCSQDRFVNINNKAIFWCMLKKNLKELAMENRKYVFVILSTVGEVICKCPSLCAFNKNKHLLKYLH